MNRIASFIVAVVLAGLLCPGAQADSPAPKAGKGASPASATQAAAPGEFRLEFRRIDARDSLPEAGQAVPGEAVKVFLYESEPRGVNVTDPYIAVDYGVSGVLVDRATGNIARRFTVADGWRSVRPEAFGPDRPRRREGFLAGPGVLERWTEAPGRDAPVPDQEVVSVTLAGKTWRAMQPGRFLSNSPPKDTRRPTWTSLLQALSEKSYVQVESPGEAPARYTMAAGLAGNIVTHLAAAGGTLWAACVDIYDPQRNQWGPGGLCRLDPKTSRFERIGDIEGTPVRWVTLLQAVGDELWVGFREGSGVAGDFVSYGMGVYPGDYRPNATAIVLARLSAGKWTVFRRALPAAPPPAPRGGAGPQDEGPSSPIPRRLGLLNGQAMLFCQTPSRAWGNFDVGQDGSLWLLNLTGGAWRAFDAQKDFQVRVINDMVAGASELLVTSDRGVHRWDDKAQAWRFLDSGCDLKNSNLFAAAAVGQELWVGYNVLGFDVVGEQGISRYDESAGKWSYFPPGEIGTACPVKRIAPLPNGEVWVLFTRRTSTSAARESFAPDDRGSPEGVGRHAGGKWTFPAKIEGLPATVQRSGKSGNQVRQWEEKVRVNDLAVLGKDLYLATNAGLYAGPGAWRRVMEGGVRSVTPAEDEKSVILLCDRPGGPEGVERLQLDPATGQQTPMPFTPRERSNLMYAVQEQSLLTFPQDARWVQMWVAVPTAKEGRWVIGPLNDDGGYHKVLTTPQAVWLASRGQLIRLDRKLLADWLGK